MSEHELDVARTEIARLEREVSRYGELLRAAERVRWSPDADSYVGIDELYAALDRVLRAT